jgi:hypothetical protein
MGISYTRKGSDVPELTFTGPNLPQATRDAVAVRSVSATPRLKNNFRFLRGVIFGAPLKQLNVGEWV